jgi:tripartite ATP-independent transporter DctP family solute receptor
METKRLMKAVAALACLAIATPAGALELRLAHSADTSHPNHIAFDAMAKRVAERSKGAVLIKIFPANALGSPPEQAEQVRLGVLDLAMLSPSQLDKFDRAFGVVFIPYQFDDYAHAHRTLDGPARPWLVERGRKQGFEIVATNFEWGFRSLTNSVRPVNTPDDMKGMKLRVPPEIQIKAAMEALGAVAHTIAFPEVYLALANKTVDGQDNPVPTNFTSKFYEVQKHLALTKHVYTPMFLVASAKSWSGKLSDAQRKILAEEANKAGAEARRMVQDKENWYIAEMEKAGVRTTRPDVAPFRARMEPAYKAIKQYVGDDAWVAWEKYVREARSR